MIDEEIPFDIYYLLSPLTAADWPLVRDIFLRVEKSVVGDNQTLSRALVKSGIVSVGESGAKRLRNDDDTTICEKLLPIISIAQERVAEGLQRFRIDHAGLAFRVEVGRNAAGHTLMLRVLPHEAPSLKQLKLPPNVQTLFLGRSMLEGGLILIAGHLGGGKTTTASAIVRSRLEVYAGHAQTVEYPCELPLQGVWGKGVCMQRPVEAIDAYEPPSDSFFRALIGTLRLFPAIPCGTILMAGEIPDSRTAIEILKAAASGHLVIATINARSAVDALRIMAMLCAPGGDNLDPEAAREMLAVALKGVWCQRLSWHNQGPDWNRCEISGDLIWSGESVARAIRRGNFESLDNIAKKQNDTIANMRQDRPLGAEEIEKLLWRAETPKLSLDRG